MAYLDVDTAFRAVRASGDTYGRIEAGLLRQAATRIPIVANTDDQREWKVCAAIMDGSFPAQWVKGVMLLLDIAAQLASPTDANINTQVVAAFPYFIKTRAV